MPAKSVGILGGGQLSRMMAEAARGLGLEVLVWAESADVPAADAGFPVEIGKFSDRERLARFLRGREVVAFENEFVDCDLLADAAGDRTDVFRPGLDTIRQWQDKLGQKALLNRLGIPSAPYDVMPAMPPLDAPPESWRAPLGEWLERASRENGCVLKWSRFGYDGKGVFLWDPHAGDLGRAIAFCRDGIRKGARIYAEERVRFAREVAIVGVAGVACADPRAAGDGFTAYPLVVSEQREGICYRVRGPAAAFGASEAAARIARDSAERLAKGSGIRGAFAIEFFDLGDGRVWVNELAPRVHNTGHFTLNAARTSQFENHWRGLLGMPAGDTSCDPAFAMLNLLGPPGISRSAEGLRLPEAPAGCHAYWYGKREIRPGRKLGHVNASVGSAAALAEAEAKLANYETRWAGALAGKGESE